MGHVWVGVWDAKARSWHRRSSHHGLLSQPRLDLLYDRHGVQAAAAAGLAAHPDAQVGHHQLHPHRCVVDRFTTGGHFNRPIETHSTLISSNPKTTTGLVFLPLGIVLKLQSDRIVEYSLQYDGAGTPAALAACQITPTTLQPAPPCTVTFTVDRTMHAPVYVYYQLDNFYQNHRRYVKSRSDAQLMGVVLPESGLADCDPLKTITDNGQTKVLSPCGLIANRWVGLDGCGGHEGREEGSMYGGWRMVEALCVVYSTYGNHTSKSG